MWKGFFDIREYMGKNFNFKQISNSYVIQEPNQVGQAIKSVGRMTLASGAEEGRDKLRKAAVRSKYP